MRLALLLQLKDVAQVLTEIFAILLRPVRC
jgi:hypothetical protein